MFFSVKSTNFQDSFDVTVLISCWPVLDVSQFEAELSLGVKWVVPENLSYDFEPRECFFIHVGQSMQCGASLFAFWIHSSFCDFINNSSH
jgi:hypothetical protein